MERLQRLRGCSNSYHRPNYTSSDGCESESAVWSALPLQHLTLLPVDMLRHQVRYQSATGYGREDRAVQMYSHHHRHTWFQSTETEFRSQRSATTDLRKTSSRWD